MVGETAKKTSLSQRANLIGPDTDPWKAFVKPERVGDAPLQTVVHRSLQEAARERQIHISDLNRETGSSKLLIYRQDYWNITNTNLRPEPDVVQKLLQQPKLPPEQRAVLLMYTDEDLLMDRRRLLIAEAMQNFPLPYGKGEQERDKRLRENRKKWDMSRTQFENNVRTGAKCHGDIALKVLFILGCSLDQGTEILAACGFCWRDNPAAEFLQEKLVENRRKMLSGKNYSLTFLLADLSRWQKDLEDRKKQSAA